VVLNDIQFRNITHHCLKTVAIGDGYYGFERFDERQYRHYESQSESRAIRARCTSSVAFDFISDTTEIRFCYRMLERTNRSYAGFDLYIDRIFCDHLFFETLPEQGTVSFSIAAGGKGPHRITVWLPWAMNLEIGMFSVDDGSMVEKVEKSKKILFFGDSITQGYDATYPSMSYVNRVGRHFDAEILNQGIGGYVFDSENLFPDIGFEPDLIFVAYGTNDKRKDMNAYRNNVGGYMRRLSEIYPKQPIYVITPIWRTDVSGTEEFDRVYPIIEAACAPYPNITVVDGRSCVPHLTSFFADRRVHPSDLGFGEYANRLISLLSETAR